MDKGRWLGLCRRCETGVDGYEGVEDTSRGIATDPSGCGWLYIIYMGDVYIYILSGAEIYI